jgi:hypothetical protein
MGGKQSTSNEKYYTGEFNCSVSLFDEEIGQYKELREAQDYLLEIEPFAFEIMSDFIEKHVVDFINRHLEAAPTKELLLGYGFGGDHGDGNGYFSVPFKLTKIPPMYFEMTHTKRNAFKLKKPVLTLYGKETEDKDVLSKFVMNFSVELKENNE